MKHNWEYKRLGEVASILYGFPFESTKFNSDSKGTPLIRIRDVVPGCTSTYYDGEYSENYLIEKGDYLIGMDGEFNIAPWRSEKALLNQRVCKIKSNTEKKYISAFLFYYLKITLKHIEEKTSFVTVKHLSAKVLNQILVPVPPKEVQEQIVAELDEINAMIEVKKEQIKQLDLLAQSIFYDTFGDPVTNPKGWETDKVKEIALVKIGPFGSLLHKEDYISNGTPLVNPIHMKDKKIFVDNNFTVSTNKISELTKYLLKKSDIIFGRRGDIGRCALVTDKENGYVCGTGSLFVRFKIKIDPVFSIWCFSQPYLRDWLIEQAKGATMLNINCEIVERLPIILPPIELQEEFAKKVEAIEERKKEIEETLKELKTLLDSRMDYWFN